MTTPLESARGSSRDSLEAMIAITTAKIARRIPNLRPDAWDSELGTVTTYPQLEHATARDLQREFEELDPPHSVAHCRVTVPVHSGKVPLSTYLYVEVQPPPMQGEPWQMDPSCSSLNIVDVHEQVLSVIVFVLTHSAHCDGGGTGLAVADGLQGKQHTAASTDTTNVARIKFIERLLVAGFNLDDRTRRWTTRPG